MDPSGRFAYEAGPASPNTRSQRYGRADAHCRIAVAAGFDPLSVAMDPREGLPMSLTWRKSALAFTINPATGALMPVAGLAFRGGVAAAFVAVDPTGRFVYVANATDIQCRLRG